LTRASTPSAKNFPPQIDYSTLLSAVRVGAVEAKRETITPVPSHELWGKPTVEASLELNDPLEAVVDMA